MSMIGDFGVCSKSNYDELENLIKNGRFVEAEDLIKEIYNEVENSAADLENGKCSGEVFIALFHYLKTACGIDVRCNSEGFGEKWRDTTGDFDVIAFYEKEKVLLLEDKIDYGQLSQFINDFFQIDYGNAGQIACGVLFNNLKSMGTDNILIWHLY